MKKKVIIKISQLKVNDSTQGETIEKKFQRILENKEPITDGAPLIYTERKDGVQAGYNIRTDRWDVALDVMNVVHRSRAAKRENTPEPEQNKATGTDGTAEPTQGTTE